MLIYAVIAFAVNGVGKLAQVEGDGETALAEIFAQRDMGWVVYVVLGCALLGITAATMTNLMSESRILYSYAKDGLFYPIFKEICTERQVPVKGSWISIIPICIFAFFMNMTLLAKFCSLCNLMTYAFIDAALLTYRLNPLHVT